MTALQPFPAYRDSGVEWLGTVPEHWEVRRLKSLLDNIVDSTPPQGRGQVKLALEHVESWTGRIRSTGAAAAFDSQAKRFRAGDILFGKLRPYLAKVTRPKRGGACVGEFLVLRPARSAVGARYMEHFLRSKKVIEVVNSSTFGAKMPRADWTFIGGLPAVLPTPVEQTAIARFLDDADRRIRRYIRAKERLIELLEEERRATIHEAVTGRIDVRTGQPYPAYKDSGVEWLGEVPEPWEVAGLGYRYEQCLGKMLDGKRITGKHLVPYLRNVDVQWNGVNVVDLPRMDIHPDEIPRYTVQAGDLLVCEGGEVGRCAIWKGEIDRCGFQKALHRLRPRNDERDSPRFLYYALAVAVASGAFADGHASTIAHLTGEKLRRHRFAFPFSDQQTAIVRYLDDAERRISARRETVARQIALLREYRTRLIADVVTGKLDVREAAAGLPDRDPLASDRDRADANPTETNLHWTERDVAKEAIQ